jgi:membrane-associated phospholipid phosphatase
MPSRFLHALLDPCGPWLSLALFVAVSILAATRVLHPLDVAATRAAGDLWSPVFAWAWAILSLVASPEGSGILMLGLAALIWRRQRRVALAFLGVLVAGDVIEVLMKHFLVHPNPSLLHPLPGLSGVDQRLIAFLLTRLGTLGLSRITENSYPSGHMLRAILLAAAVCAAFPGRRVRVAAIIVVICTAAVLIETNVHWASDVLSGALLGYGLATLARSKPAFSRSLGGTSDAGAL